VLGALLYWYERSTLLGSQTVLTDTESHRRFLRRLFHVPAEKIAAVPVGADEDLFAPPAQPRTRDDSRPLEVLFYGSFLPLHGIDFILSAANALRDESVHVTLVGGNRLDLSAFRRRVQELGLKNVTHLEWVGMEQLPSLIAAAGLGLGGPFGGTPQARRVVTAKTFQFLAMAKAVVIGRTSQESGFRDRDNCLLVPQADAEALAGAILWAQRHRADLAAIGRRGYQLYRNRYSSEHISEKLRRTLFE
jgi:glycosyltransferase involved in cell wall biosynthesis